MGWLSDVYDSLFGSTDTFTNDAVQAQLALFRAFLNGGTNPIVRFWVEGGASYGHQAATANLVYRMARPVGADNLNFAYGGAIEIYYELAADLAKLQELIPELGRALPNINNASVTATLWTAAPVVAATLGFTGGASATVGYLTKLNVTNFLVLQPYRWPVAEVIQRTGQPNLDLSTVAMLGAGFANRLYYLDPGLYQNPPWAAYAANTSVLIVREICDNWLVNFQLLTTYSIKSGISRLNANPTYGAALVCGSAMAWQRQNDLIYAAAKPVIILNFDDFGTPAVSEEPGLRDILAGRTAPSENGLSVSLGVATPDRNLVANFNRRSAYFIRQAADSRFTYLNYPTTVAAVTAALTTIQQMPALDRKQQVIFIQLGRTPQAFFNYAILQSSLPALFEGQNTTNTAINMGVAYMQVPAPTMTVQDQLAIYPSVTLQGLNPADVPNELAKAARQINSQNSVWPENAADAPCFIVGNYYRRYTDELPTDRIHAYFAALQAHYARASQDKFCLAVAYLNTLLQPPPPQLQAADDDNPLNELYATLESKVAIGETLNLVPDVLSSSSGTIAKYILNFLAKYSNVLSLTVNVFDHVGEPPSVTSITLDGPSTVFSSIGVQCNLTVVFTAPDNQLTADITFTDQSQWIMPNAPWIVLDRPFIHMQVPNGQFPVAASFGGYYPALESSTPSITARLEISVNNQSQWGAAIGFEGNYPGIATIFQMATSINLVQALPPPFNILTDLGVSTVDLQYDYAQSLLNSIAITAESNSQNLKLFNTLTLSNILVSAVVVAPTTTRELAVSASADFSIGTSDPAIIGISVSYPGFTLQGALTSGVITLENLFSTFLPAGYSLTLPSAPTIDQFSFSFTPSTEFLTVALQLNIEWTFSFFGNPLFVLEDVGFEITRLQGVNTGFITADTVLLPASQKIGVTVGAYYLGSGNWRFEANQTAGVFSLDDLLTEYLGANWKPPISFPDLDGLSLTMVWENNKATSFEFVAKTASPWTPILVLPQVTVTGNAKIGYIFSALVEALSADDQPGAYGTLSADVTIWNIDLKVTYDFNPSMQKLCLAWKGATACLIEENNETTATFTLGDTTVGAMVSEFVTWATGASFSLASPWDLLNDMSLSGLSVIYNFTLKTVQFKVDIGSLDFGLFKITAIGLAYDSTRTQGKVAIKIDGSFVWAPNENSLSWDPADPSSTPAPPGGGNKYLDLRLLALGQHVTVAGLTEQRQVQDVIALLRDLTLPTPPEIPVGGQGQPIPMPENSWFVAFDFGLLKAEDEKDAADSSTALTTGADDDPPPVYFIQLSIVFNDPVLYALQIALDGPMAKIFAGLNFQIMYRQVSDTVGCYSAQIALPNIMRTFQIGVASVTLPVFGIDVYTNGDFQVDIGFPWQMDFSRSFTIQVIVLGVPVLGSAGFYFGKLSSATTNLVPKADNGWFNPVIVFGFGAQIGLGKTIDAGILTAGFSLTVFGIIEGVLARWLPYEGATPAGNPNSLQDGYYFSLTGTFGLQGRLYGSVDFVVIKGTVDVAISMYIRFVFAAYEDILISATASVSISVSLEINLGFFSITISFSFAATVSASFTLANPMGGSPPWHLPAGSIAALQMHERRMLHAAGRAVFSADLGAAPAVYVPNWDNLAASTKVAINGWMAPVLTVAGDTAATPADQLVCYVVNFFLPLPPPVETPSAAKANAVPKHLNSQARRVESHELPYAALARSRKGRSALLQADVSGASFEDLAVRILEWILAAGLTGTFTPETLGQQIVTREYLEAAVDYLSGASTSTPIPADKIETFLAQQADLVFSLATGTGAASGAYFPASPGTVLDVPQYPPAGGDPLFHYAFGDYNSSSADYTKKLNDYFNELLVQMQPDEPEPQREIAAAETGPSVASFTFSDYFAVVGKQAVQALLDGLKNFKLLIDMTKTVQGLVDWINTTGNESGGTIVLTTPPELFKANENHALSSSGSVTLMISAMQWQSPGRLSFGDVAGQSLFNHGFDATTLAKLNADDSRILAPSVPVTYATQPPYITQSGDSLTSIAKYFDVPLATLLSGSDVLASQALISPLAYLAIPGFSYPVAAGDTIAGVAARFAVSVDTLANANLSVASLFDATSDPNLNVPELVQFQVQALIDEADRTLALQNLAAMTSRFYLSGLRLPTDGLTANYPGLFVTGTEGSYKYPDTLGLFALTGQAFPLPAIASISPAFSFSLTRGAGETWLSLGSEGSSSVTYQLDQADDLARYNSLGSAAHGGRFESGMSPLSPLDAASLQPGRYPLAQRIAWQTTVAITLPQQVTTPVTPQPSLWTLPDPMINLPGATDRLPRFKPMLARTDAATGNTVEQTVGNFGFGTLITFSLRRTSPVAGSPASSRFYEIIGATQSDILLLQRLLDRLMADDSTFQQMLLLYAPPSTGSDVTGWQSDDQSVSLMGIGQVNLSTDTRPPASGFTALALNPNAPLLNVINKPTEFLRLLWEASITRSGGFYLSYTTGIGGSELAGLPDRIFSNADVAQVAVLSLFKIDQAHTVSIGVVPGQCVAGYMNVVATNEALDLSDAALIAEAVLVPTTTRAVTVTDTLAALAAEYYTDPGLLVSLNGTATLGGSVTIASGRYEVPPDNIAPGGDLSTIATYFNTTAQAIKDANRYRTDWPNPLPAYTGLLLPPITVKIGTAPGGSTPASLAAYYDAPTAAIASANLLVPGFFAAGAVLNVQIGPVTVASLVEAGVAGFNATRTAPEPLPAPGDQNFADWGSLYLQHIFNLLGYRVADNPDFRLSAWGLPGSPAKPDGDPTTDKIQAPVAPAAGDAWIYTRTLPYPSLAKNMPQLRAAGLPAPDESPYLGVGGLLQFDIEWQDIFGNLILSELSRPQSAADLPASPPAEIAGYTDALIGMGQWPAVANAFRFVPDNKSQPTLELQLIFDQTQFTGADPGTAIQHAINVYKQVLFQLSDPNGVIIAVTTSVLPTVQSLLTAADAASLLAWVENIYLWLTTLPNGTAFNPELTLTLVIDATKLNDGQIFRVTTSLTIGRNPHLVDGQLSTASGVSLASTLLAPWTGPIAKVTVDSPQLADYNHWREQAGQPPATDPNAIPRDLAAFSSAFTAAFSSLANLSMHIATGSDSNAFTSSSLNNLWAVQLGVAQQSTAISYAITNAAAPRQFAPRPISNKLVSRAKTPIIPYTTGKVISPEDPSTDQAFATVDLDQWMRFTLTQIDALLSPKYVAPAVVLRALSTGPDALQLLLDAKEGLASLLKTAMIPVFADETATPDQQKDIQETFYQSILGTLSQYYAVKTGIQFDTNVNASIAANPGDTQPPRLYGNILALPVTAAGLGAAPALPSNVSLSSPKLNLAFASGQPVTHYLSLLLSSTTTREASITLNLAYSCQNIEQEISNLPGIEGYQPSTWLSFADDTTQAGWPLNTTLGQFDVPLVLRAFPATPTLVQQASLPTPTSPCYKPPLALQAIHRSQLLTAGGCSEPGSYDPLAQATLWNYSFTYSLAVHSLNDAIHATIVFNTQANSNLLAMAAVSRDLFDNLAEFTTVYPQVLADLNTYLAPIDVSTTDATQITNAQAALQSAAALVQWIADSSGGLAANQQLRAKSFAAAVDPYVFTVTESSVSVQIQAGTQEDVLCVTVALAATPPANWAAPMIQIQPATYTCEPYGAGDDKTFSFVYVDANGVYLTTTQAAGMAERSFILGNLDVLECQNAEISVYLTRNEFLAGKKIADVFVYTTPTVSLPDPLLPTLTVSDPVNLALINAVDANTPVTRSLDCQLSELYQVLFVDSGTDSVTLTLTAYYEYSPSSQLPPLRLPVYLMPPTAVAIRDGGTGTPLAQIVTEQSTGCSAWFHALLPSTSSATLYFDLTIMSDLTARPMPILHLSSLFVSLSNLNPPLS